MRTDNLQLRIQLQSTVESTLNEIRYNNHISATDMQEAIEHYLLTLKEAVMAEYVNWSMQDKAKIETQYKQLLEEQKETEVPQEVDIEEE